jgi:hypothetical protein
MSTMELEGLRTDASPTVKRRLWSPRRWALSLASLLVASCGHFSFSNGGDNGGVDAGDGSVDAGDAGDAGVDAALPMDGLVAWYPMDKAITTDSTGHGTFVDASGHDNNGTCDPGSCPTFEPHPTGRSGGAYTFDGIDDLFHVPSKPELEDKEGFTITAWIKRAESSPSACVINKSYSTKGDNSWQACIRGDDGAVRFYSGDGGTGGDDLDGGTIDTSAWHHLALWWDGSSKAKATYVDGALVAGPKTVSIPFDDAAIDIGSDYDVNLATKFVSPLKGLIADVRIYNLALSPPEIMALASQ